MAIILPPVFRSSALADGELEVLSVEGAEGISRLYRLELELQTAGAALPFPSDQVDALLAERCVVELAQDVKKSARSENEGVMEHRFHGVLSELEVGSVDQAPGEQARIRYRAVLVPRLWYLTRNVRTRLFQDLSVPEIIQHVLTESGLEADDLQLDLEEEHPKREYVLQYKESDFQFLSRLAEDEGIFFFFDQTPDREVVVFADHREAFPPYSLLQSIDGDAYAHVHYDPRASVDSAPGIASLIRRYKKPLAAVVVHDYDYTQPETPIHEVGPVLASGAGIFHHYLEGAEYTRTDTAPADPLPEQAARVALIRAQERALERETIHAGSTALGLFSGYTFELESHFDDALVFASSSPERRHAYLVTGARFVVGLSDAVQAAAGVNTLGFKAELTVVNLANPYRPPRETPRPVVAGLLTAKVADLVKSTGAEIDDHGQYSLVLNVETVGAPNLKGTTVRRFRMAKPFAGASYGMHFPLHVGSEVLLAHLGGDPDRPIIIAAVPNHTQQTPVDASNSTVGGFKTRANVVVMFNDHA